MAKPMKKFRAKKDAAPKFTDVGESNSYPEVAAAPKQPKKYYPKLHLRKKIKGLHQVGMTKTIRAKVRVHSMEHRAGEEPQTGLEVHAIHAGEE